MNTLLRRNEIEKRFGPLGSGVQELAIRGVTYSLIQLLSQIGAEFDDTRPIDALIVTEGRYVLRYLDGQDQRVVACEFDGEFHLLGETRASIAEWEGESSNFASYSGH